MFTPKANLEMSSASGSAKKMNRNRFSITLPRYNNSPNCSHQTSFIAEETDNHRVELFGAKPPVLVSEALTVSERGADLTTRIFPSGWACMVFGRSLYVWNYCQVGQQKFNKIGCKELILPASDLSHKADLVCIINTSNSSFPAVLASSPEGVLRYWSNIGHENNSSEHIVELHGQECYSMIETPEGCILATTTNSLVLVTATETNVKLRSLKVPQGVLAGLGKRMSSFIFGPIPAQSSETKSMVKILKDTQGSTTVVYVLAGMTLYKWELNETTSDKMIFEIDLERNIKDHFLEYVWNGNSALINQSQCWCVDFKIIRKGIVLLFGANTPELSEHTTFAFAMLETLDSKPPIGISNFWLPNISEEHFYNEENIKMILPSTNARTVYLYSATKVVALPLNSSRDERERDVIDFSTKNSKILGAGTLEGQVIFFTNNYGFVKLIPTYSDISLNVPYTEEHMDEAEGNLEMSSENLVTCLKSALVNYCHNERLHLKNSMRLRLEPVLDETVAALSKELLDDHPSSDPRWTESASSSYQSNQLSVILINQLQDKLKAHSFYRKFLQATGLWNKLGLVILRNIPMPTKLLILEHAEKLVTAISLKNLHSQYDYILSSVIKTLIDQKQSSLPNSRLTPQDIFYREVSAIESIFLPLIQDWEEKELASGSRSPIDIISSVNSIILTSLQDALQFRRNYQNVFDENLHLVEYIPWTSTEDMRTLIIKQHKLTTSHLEELGAVLQTNMFQQAMELADLLLEGFRSQLSTIHEENHYKEIESQYIEHRTRMINTLYETKQYERATSLAEKYRDFGMLMKMCEDTQNQERKERYMNEYDGFAQFAFTWYIKEGKKGKLLSQSSQHHNELNQFLTNYNSPLSWLHNINTGQYTSAHTTLEALGNAEQQYLAKKKTLLSLSKLACLASSMPKVNIETSLEEINQNLELVEAQETLPEAIMDDLDLDIDTMRVFTPEELIEVYIGDNNISANEYDYKKALNIFKTLKKGGENRDALIVHIWAKAILRDEWLELDTQDPQESLKDTIFFRTMELIFNNDEDIWENLPPYESLIQSIELSSFTSNANFVFLMQAAYEYVTQVLDN